MFILDSSLERFLDRFITSYERRTIAMEREALVKEAIASEHVFGYPGYVKRMEDIKKLS